MICKNCRTNFEGNFCPNCGLSVVSVNNENTFTAEPIKSQNTINHQAPFYPYNVQNISTNEMPKKIKKPFYKKWWFWVIAFVVFCLILSSFNSGDDSSNNSSDTTNIVESETKTEDETKTTTTTTTTTTIPTLSKEEFKKQCTTISFDTLSRNPDKYKGKKYKFTGEVIQVSESTILGSTYCDLRINVTQGSYRWEDTIYATVVIGADEDRILEDDIITIWGTCDGLYTYESVMGASISLPCIDIEYFTIN